MNAIECNECCICMEAIGKTNNCVTECGHSFCLKCLATSLRINVACPMCRHEIIESESDEEEEDYEEEEDDEEDDDDEDDEEAEEAECDDAPVVLDDHEREDECPISELVVRLEKQGITYENLVSMIFTRYPKTYTKKHIRHINKVTENVVNDADDEVCENRMFAAEDVRIQ